ncbi:MAG: hypothetical protein HZB46_05665 [Solirubrobacterales bacterium]|nr:hypothetical protein [Solirubrobacterales bacterium]
MSERAWLALLDAAPAGADHCAPVAGGGVLAAWVRRAKPVRAARRIHPAVLDGGGAPAVVSLVLPPAGAGTPFDDVAVQHARRTLLAGPPFDAVTTLLRDDRHFAGSLLVARGAQVARLRDDPFARISPARVLRVGPGLLGAAPWPAGPVIERYGSAQPWPGDRFA